MLAAQFHLLEVGEGEYMQLLHQHEAGAHDDFLAQHRLQRAPSDGNGNGNWLRHLLSEMKPYQLLLYAVGLIKISISPCAAQTRPELLRSVQAPGVVSVGDSLFIDEAEMASTHWLE